MLPVESLQSILEADGSFVVPLRHDTTSECQGCRTSILHRGSLRLAAYGGLMSHDSLTQVRSRHL